MRFVTRAADKHQVIRFSKIFLRNAINIIDGFPERVALNL
jgi:hypothetical protein